MGEAILSRRGGGGGANIKSSQKIESYLDTSVQYVDVPITPIDTTVSIVLLSYQSAAADNPSAISILAEIINSTTVRVSRAGATGSLVWFNIEVVEFNNVKSLQRGKLTVTSSEGDSNIAITSVNLAKSFAVGSFASSKTEVAIRWVQYRYRLTATNQLRLTLPWDGAGLFAWQVIEFK